MKSTIQSWRALCRARQGIPCIYFMLGFLFGINTETVVGRVVSVFKHLL
jgi:hypothetical protein